MRWDLFSVHLDRKISRVATNRIRSVKHSGGINEKSRAGKFTMLIGGVNLYDRLRASFENCPDLCAIELEGISAARKNPIAPKSARAKTPKKLANECRKDDSGRPLKVESRLITHRSTVEHVARSRCGPLSVGAFVGNSGAEED